MCIVLPEPTRTVFLFSSVKGRILCTITCENSVSWSPLDLNSVMSVGSEAFERASQTAWRETGRVTALGIF